MTHDAELVASKLDLAARLAARWPAASGGADPLRGVSGLVAALPAAGDAWRLDAFGDLCDLVARGVAALGTETPDVAELAGEIADALFRVGETARDIARSPTLPFLGNGFVDAARRVVDVVEASAILDRGVAESINDMIDRAKRERGVR